MSVSPNLASGLRHGVFWITKRIAQGQFATPERATFLRDQRVTHVLNVSDSASIVTATDFGFECILDRPIADFARIPDADAISAVDAIHEMLVGPDSRLYVHCIAGQNRSPTILWLYLIACGMSQQEASGMIVERSPDAVPGHRSLVDERLVTAIASHGEANYRPLRDLSVLEPAF